MILKLTNFPGQNYPRPSDEVDPKYKLTPEWHLLWNQFIYGQYQLGNTGVKVYEQDQIEINRSYAAGRQNPQIYKDLLAPEQVGPRYIDDKQFDSLMNHGETMMSVNFDQIFSPLPKIMLAIQAIMDETEHQIKVSAVDEKSTSLKKQLKWQAFIEGAYKPFFDYISTMEGIGIQQSVLPASVEELELMEKIGSFKLAYEIAMKDAITLTENVSKIKKIKRKVVYDLACCGKAAVQSYNDVGGVTKQRYIDFADLIIEDSDEEDNSDSNWGSALIWISACDLRAQCDISEKELEKISKKWSKQKKGVLYGTERKDGAVWYDSVKIPVFHSYYKSIDEEYKTQHVDGRVYNEPWRIETGIDGKVKKYIPPKQYDSEFRTTTVHKARVLYTSKWIADTSYVFDYHVEKDMPFDYFAKDVKLPFLLYKIPGKPMVESMIPVADDIQLTYLQLQNARATAPPDGLKIEISSISNIKIGKKTLHPLDVLKIYSHTGRLLYRVAPLEPGNPIGSQNPVDRIEGGYDSAVTSAARSLQLAYNELNRISGIADIAVGGNPQNEQGLGVTRIALATTSQTLKPVYTGWITTKGSMAEYSAIKIHSSIIASDGPESPYYEMLGPAKFNAIKGAGPYPPTYWGMEIVATVDQAIKDKIIETAGNAMAVGKDGVPILNYSEYLYVVSKIQEECNVDDIRAYIAFKEQKASEEANKRAQESQVLNGKITQETELAKVNAKIQEAKELSKIKIDEDAQLSLNKARLLVVEYKLKQELETQSIKTQADVDNGQMPGVVQPPATQPAPSVSQPA